MFRIVSREHAGFRAVHAEEHVGQLSLQSVGRVQRLPEESMNVFFPTGDREYHMRAWPGGVITRTPLLHEERSSMSGRWASQQRLRSPEEDKKISLHQKKQDMFT
jgi:hypothetical protein